MIGDHDDAITPLARVAVRVDSADNCAVVKTGVAAGTSVEVEGREVTVRTDVGPGHRFALAEIPAGEFVLQYAQPIGTSRGLAAGDAITEITI